MSENPNSPKHLAFDLFKKGNVQESLNMFNANLKDNQHDPWFRHDRARVMVEAGGTAQVKQAEKDLEAVHKQFPKDAQAAVSLAIAAGRAGDVRRCLQYYKLARELDPQNHEVVLVNDILTTGTPEEQTHRLHDRAISYFQKGEYREALRYYDLAVAVGGERNAVWSLHDKGIALMRVGQFEEAAKILEKVKSIMPESFIPYLDLAELYELISTTLTSKESLHYPFHDIASTYCYKVLEQDKNNARAREIILKNDGLQIDRNKKHRVERIVVADDSTVWLDENDKPVKRDINRERAAVKSYLDEIKQTDPDYYAHLERLAKKPTMHPMENGCRVSVNIPAWMEGKCIYKVLMMYVKQTDKKGELIDPNTFEININLNRLTGSPMDHSVEEIERFIKDTGGKYRINYINVENDPPFNRIGHARRLLTDLNLLRSLARSAQSAALYIESEDADLEAIDPHTITNVIHTMDANPHLDALRGIQDFWPTKLQENDFLFLQRRLWNFAEVLMRRQKYRQNANPRWNMKWNRVITGGWNTAYSAEAYALIRGYSNLITGSDMDIGEKITAMRGDSKRPNLNVIGVSSIKSSSSPRRFIESIYADHPPYADAFADDTVNLAIRSANIDQQLKSISHLARISEMNAPLFQNMLANFQDFYREVTPNEEEARKLMGGVLAWLGFQKTDFIFDSTGKIQVTNWENVKNTLNDYRERHKVIDSVGTIETATPLINV